MDTKNCMNYTVEDFIADESFVNYHLHLNIRDEIFWKRWIAMHPEKTAVVKKAQDTIQALSITISESEYREELEKITNSINAAEARDGISLLHINRKRRSGVNKRRSIIFLLPVLLLIITSTIFLLRYFKNTGGSLTEINNSGNDALVVTLSDSTVVTLSPHSILKYPKQFSAFERNVYLQGDAGFTVKRNETAPFKVFAENIVATVLGTIFNIKRSGDTALVVDLLKGKLTVEINTGTAASQSILLSPTESAVYVRSDKHFYKRLYAPENKLSFHKNDFEEIARQIKQVYGITLINYSKKSNWRFTGEFKNISAIEIIKYITHIEKLSYEVTGDTILIK